ncbi:MAG: magnesium transporter CorA family protein [bacterium]|nr:magnesium transporter CorA family protein [bacterium]
MFMETIKIKNLTWVDIVDPKKEDIEYLKQNFDFHPIVLGELTIHTLRPKVENYDHYLYMVLHFPIYHPEEKTSKSMEIDFLITPTTLITVRYGKIQPLQEFWKKCEAKDIDPHFGETTASLLYYMIGELNNFSSRQLDHITRKIDDIEKEIFGTKNIKKEEKIVEEISIVRRDILDFRRILKPQNTIFESLKTRGTEFFGKSEEPYFVDIIGDHMRVWNLLENNKETIESLQEANDSLLSNRTNRIMKIITLFAVIVFPLTLVAAIFGMNTKYLPIIGMENDFWIILGIMFIGTISMLILFKIKKWL